MEDYLFTCDIEYFRYHLYQNSVNFGQNVIGKTILPGPTGGKWNFLKGSPKCPTKISEWQMCLPFETLNQFQLPGWNYNQAELILGSHSK